MLQKIINALVKSVCLFCLSVLLVYLFNLDEPVAWTGMLRTALPTALPFVISVFYAEMKRK